MCILFVSGNDAKIFYIEFKDQRKVKRQTILNSKNNNKLCNLKISTSDFESDIITVIKSDLKYGKVAWKTESNVGW